MPPLNTLGVQTPRVYQLVLDENFNYWNCCLGSDFNFEVITGSMLRCEPEVTTTEGALRRVSEVRERYVTQ